ncbi:MAG: PhoU domain-containing protein [Longimicrobiales bacterium]
MWKDILSLLRGSSLCQEAFEESLQMLETSYGMFTDAVAALHKEGALVDDIYERDRQLNKFERDVRRKIVTHLSVSSTPDVNMGLVITAIVIDIERIGDYAKNISELAVESEAPFDALELNTEIRHLERLVDGNFADLLLALENSDEERARGILKRHKEVSGTVERHLKSLRRGGVLAEDSGRAVTAALYLRYLKRMSAHLKNVATSVVNPYHRIGFREKKKS